MPTNPAEKQLGGFKKKIGDFLEKKCGTRSPKQLLLKLDKFAKPLPKDLP